MPDPPLVRQIAERLAEIAITTHPTTQIPSRKAAIAAAIASEEGFKAVVRAAQHHAEFDRCERCIAALSLAAKGAEDGR